VTGLGSFAFGLVIRPGRSAPGCVDAAVTPLVSGSRPFGVWSVAARSGPMKWSGGAAVEIEEQVA